MFRFFITPKNEKSEEKPNQDIYLTEDMHRELLSQESALKYYFEALNYVVSRDAMSKPELGSSPPHSPKLNKC